MVLFLCWTSSVLTWVAVELGVNVACWGASSNSVYSLQNFLNDVEQTGKDYEVALEEVALF